MTELNNQAVRQLDREYVFHSWSMQGNLNPLARLADFFGHDHRFEAYVPAAKRNLGYFALPVLIGDRIAAAIDAKADRAAGRLRLRQWTWLDGPRAGDRARIGEALHRFAAFQFGA